MSKKTISERLEFTKAINNLSKSKESFIEAVKVMETYKEETLTQLDLAINDKKTELNNLSNEYEIKTKDLQISLEQEIRQYGYDKAVELIGEEGQSVIDNEVLENLKTASENNDSIVEEAIKEENKKGTIALNSLKKHLELENKALMADLTAQVKQKEAECINLYKTIDTLKEEIREQRLLTKQVAEASSKGQISQVIGKQ